VTLAASLASTDPLTVLGLIFALFAVTGVGIWTAIWLANAGERRRERRGAEALSKLTTSAC
jgi:hypothetical protein